VKHGTGGKLEELILFLIIYKFLFSNLTILFTSIYYFFYLSVKAIIMFVIRVNINECSPGHLLMIIFGFITIKLLHTQNITIPYSINSVTILQMYIFHCDLSSV